ncbi:hypothetical protein KI387_019082, partial [Taxus chinensis]
MSTREKHGSQKRRKKKGRVKQVHMNKTVGVWCRTSSMICMPQPSAVCSGIRTRATCPVPQDEVSTIKDHNEFMSWLRRKAGLEVCSSLTVGMSCNGRSLFSSAPIHAGERIMRIPHNLLITPDKLPKEVEPFLGKDASNYARLALFILAEQKLDQMSEWAPYIHCLPQTGTLHSTIFWTEEELEMIRQSAIHRETMHRKGSVKKEFGAVQQALHHFPHIFGDATFGSFMHAYALVGSRAWGITSKGLALIPFADFFNHDGRSEAVLLSDEDESFSEVIADRDYALGEQVSISYGKFSNATLLLDFGFTLSHNPHDQVEIWMGLSRRDPLRKYKIELLHSHNMLTLLDANGYDTGGNSFIIKEVRSSTGRGKGIPHSLRAFARVLCACSSKELADMAAEAASYDGRLARRPFKNKSREIQAMALLLARIETLIQQHAASIMTLQFMESCKIKDSQLCIRHELAQSLLGGELRVLHSASAWLKHYCTNLSLRKQ